MLSDIWLDRKDLKALKIDEDVRESLIVKPLNVSVRKEGNSYQYLLSDLMMSVIFRTSMVQSRSAWTCFITSEQDVKRIKDMLVRYRIEDRLWFKYILLQTTYYWQGSFAEEMDTYVDKTLKRLNTLQESYDRQYQQMDDIRLYESVIKLAHEISQANGRRHDIVMFNPTLATNYLMKILFQAPNDSLYMLFYQLMKLVSADFAPLSVGGAKDILFKIKKSISDMPKASLLLSKEDQQILLGLGRMINGNEYFQRAYRKMVDSSFNLSDYMLDGSFSTIYALQGKSSPSLKHDDSQRFSIPGFEDVQSENDEEFQVDPNLISAKDGELDNGKPNLSDISAHQIIDSNIVAYQEDDSESSASSAVSASAMPSLTDFTTDSSVVTVDDEPFELPSTKDSDSSDSSDDDKGPALDF